ncbi:MAG: ABC transporter ATP-binding protein [Methanobacteriota archaeon]|nr:MAG: ABC transporter ATP-binding protein [Euryarchaeota archaeon]
MRILSVQELFLHYRTRKGTVHAVDGISFDLERGQTLAIVGESGCGKTSTASAILRMLPRNVAKYEGRVEFDGKDLMTLNNEDFRTQVRWRAVSIVFQGAMNALSPMIPVGRQVAEPLMLHLDMDKEEARAKTEEAMESVGLPRYTVDRYAHELSGGMKQRVVIAMALVMRPSLVILDEPTSALDVMTQANIMNLLKQLKEEQGLSYIFITHDLGLSSELADWVGIMYAGQLVEVGPAETVFPKPTHPYTQKLLSSVPRLKSEEKPDSIPGTPPDLTSPPKGCRFHPRCPFVFEKCKSFEPPFFGQTDRSACWLLEAGG